MLTLPIELSPSNNVRRTCHMKMMDKLVPSLSHCNEDSDNETTTTQNAKRTVSIHKHRLSQMANRIFKSMIQNHKQKGSLDFIQWDEHGWHYTGTTYTRDHWSDANRTCMKIERVLLYILALDAMNFCFWPSHDDDPSNLVQENLEYHHLAIGLKNIAEMDDVVDTSNSNMPEDETFSKNKNIQAESTYRLSPQSLSQMTPSQLEALLSPHLPGNLTKLPNIKERCRLLNELGWGLRHYHSSSATALLKEANRSADSLVSLLLSTFSGFRDESIDDQGQVIYFYKRAQIAVSDINAAMGSVWPLADFFDMDILTTFADYRVPQFLRHEKVLEYAPELAQVIDNKVEIKAGDTNEIYIRSATVEAVEMLVKEVNFLLKKWMQDNDRFGVKTLNAVKVDWYLWQLGEQLENEQKMHPHHRVKTIYY